jgi:hypothetical protein
VWKDVDFLYNQYWENLYLIIQRIIYGLLPGSQTNVNTGQESEIASMLKSENPIRKWSDWFMACHLFTGSEWASDFRTHLTEPSTK